MNKSSNKFQANTSLPSVVYLKSEFNHILVKTRSWTALSVNQVQMAGSVKFEAGAGRQDGRRGALRFDENWVLGGHIKNHCFILPNLSIGAPISDVLHKSWIHFTPLMYGLSLCNIFEATFSHSFCVFEVGAPSPPPRASSVLYHRELAVNSTRDSFFAAAADDDGAIS